jgi:hypothetical protein
MSFKKSTNWRLFVPFDLMQLTVSETTVLTSVISGNFTHRFYLCLKWWHIVQFLSAVFCLKLVIRKICHFLPSILCILSTNCPSSFCTGTPKNLQHHLDLTTYMCTFNNHFNQHQGRQFLSYTYYEIHVDHMNKSCTVSFTLAFSCISLEKP